MKKRILSIVLAVMMVVSVFVMPTSAAEATETIYSWDGFDIGDIRIAGADRGQVVDLGFKGAVATAPKVDGSIDDNEYTATQEIPHLNTAKTTKVVASYAVYGDYLYVAINSGASGHLPTSRSAVQYDIGIAASGSGEATWNRLGIHVNAEGVVATARAPFVHEFGASKYSESLNSVRNADYLVEQAYEFGIYEAKFDLGQLYRLFANLPGGQKAWDSPTVNFSFWMLTGSEDHFCFAENFTTPNGRNGDWLSSTIIIPAETLDALEAKYKGVIGELGYDWRNAIPGQLVSIEDYAAAAPTVDGKVSAADGYTTTGSWATNKKATIGDIACNFSVYNGYLYGAFVCDGEFTGDPKVHFGTFAAVNSSNMRDSRCQTTILANGTWKKDNGGMWKNAQGPTTAHNGNWENKELNSSTTAHTVWQNVVYAYDSTANKSTVEFQISIPELLAILAFEGYNPSEGNAVQFMFWPVHAGATAAFGADQGYSATVRDQVRQTNGYAYYASEILPTVELPKGCSELYYVDDVDDLGAFGQRIVEANQLSANVDGVIGAGEYTANISINPEDYILNSSSKPAANYGISQNDYYTYDDEYFYYGTKIYDPYFTEGVSQLQINMSVLNKYDTYTVTNQYTNAEKKLVYVKTLRENYIDIADVVTRASWGNVLYKDHVGTSLAGKPGSVIRSQSLTSGDLAANAQAAFSARANTFGDAGYAFAGSYDDATKTYTFETKIPLDELKNLFQLDEERDIESVTMYTLYKFKTPQMGSTDWLCTYKQHQANCPGWDALLTLTQASKGSAGLGYNHNSMSHVINFVDKPLTKKSASVRLSSSVSGLRFKSVYSNDYLAWMAEYAKAQGATMEIGTLIAPADYITGEFTHAALGAGRYVEVKADVTTPFANANGVTTIAGSLVNIKEGNLGRDFAGIGYIKIGNEYFYTDSYTVKSVSDVASAAVADTAKAQGNGYNYEVSEGVWSPYNAGQREILNALIAK